MLQNQRCKLSNFLVFYISGSISSRPAAFLFLIFLSTSLNSSWINSPMTIFSWPLIIFRIGLFVTLGKLPSRFLKCSFHICIRSSWLASFTFSLWLFFFCSIHSLFVIVYLLPSFLFYCFNLEYILFVIFGVYYFSLYLLKFLRVGICWVTFLLLHKITVFTLSRFFLSASVSFGNLCLSIGLVHMHSATASMWALTKFPYSSFGVCVLDISWRVSNLFLTVTIYSLLIFLLVSEDQSFLVVLTIFILFWNRCGRIFAVSILWSEDSLSNQEYTSQFRAQFIHFLFISL